MEAFSENIDDNSRKLIKVDMNVIDENTSVVEWTRQLPTQKFSVSVDVTLSLCDDEDGDIDFNSPELGKLCEKFLKLWRNKCSESKHV